MSTSPAATVPTSPPPLGSTRLVYTAEEVAERFGIATWTLYASVRDGRCPVPPIKVGRRMVWPRASVDKLLGLDA